jgi:hypothetical protein
MDHVAVAVEQPVELRQGGGAVAAEDGEAGGPQRAAADDLCALDGGGQRSAVDVWGAPAPAPGHRRVQLLADHVQLVDDGPAFLAQHEKPVVQAAEAVDERVPFDLTVDAGPCRYPGGMAQLEERAASSVEAPVGVASRGWGGRSQGVVVHQRSWEGARRWR